MSVPDKPWPYLGYWFRLSIPRWSESGNRFRYTGPPRRPAAYTLYFEPEPPKPRDDRPPKE